MRVEMVWNPGSAREMGRGGMRNAWRVDIARPRDCLNSLLTHILFKKRKEGRKKERKGKEKKRRKERTNISFLVCTVWEDERSLCGCFFFPLGLKRLNLQVSFGDHTSGGSLSSLCFP